MSEISDVKLARLNQRILDIEDIILPFKQLTDVLKQHSTADWEEKDTGIFVIVAPTGGGKSHLAGQLAAKYGVTKWSVEEVEKDSFLTLGHFLLSTLKGLPKEALVLEMLEQMNITPNDEDISKDMHLNYISQMLSDGKPVIIIDSLRLSLYKANGAAIEGGISSGVFTLLSSLGIISKWAGVKVIAVINPMNTDQERYLSFLDKLEASVTGVYEKSSRDANWRFISRHENSRTWVDFDLFGKDLPQPDNVTTFKIRKKPSDTDEIGRLYRMLRESEIAGVETYGTHSDNSEHNYEGDI